MRSECLCSRQAPPSPHNVPMSTPSSTLYVHPGWASANSWTYVGTSFVSNGATSVVTAVAFDVDSSLGQALSRGTMQYSLDHGQTWTNYTAPVDAQGSFVPVANTVWRFLDQNGNDDTTPNTFSAHYQLANGSVVEVDHNLTLAPRVPVTVGSTVIVHGQFEPDPGRPVIHYTHHPTGAHEGGWIQLNGRRSQ